MRVCSVEGCEREHTARGWCKAHWNRWKVTGSANPERPLRRYDPRDLPWGPLGALLAEREDLTDAWAGFVLGAPTAPAARRKAQRARDGLTIWEADRLATALGLHPALVWGESWWTADAGVAA